MKRCEQAARRRHRLLWRIHRNYVTTANEVRLGDLHFPFTRIADPDRVLDQVAQEADRRQRVTGRREPDEQLHLPYWAELWDSGMGIGQYLTHNHARVDGRTSAGLGSVLDLGCGMGLSGTIAAAVGASVLFADIEPPALLFAQLNSLPWTNRVRTCRVDWRSDHLRETFDLILGADILYERTQWPFLERFWRRHLAPDGHVLLGEPGRQTGDLFVDWIRPKGWRLDTFEEKAPTRDRPIRIFRLQVEA